MNLQLNSLSFNQIVYSEKLIDKNAKVNCKVTCYGSGLIDLLAINTLRFLGCVFSGLKPVNIIFSNETGDFGIDKVYITRRSFKRILLARAKLENPEGFYLASTVNRVVNAIVRDYSSDVSLKEACGKVSAYFQLDFDLRVDHLMLELAERVESLEGFPVEFKFDIIKKGNKVVLTTSDQFSKIVIQKISAQVLDPIPSDKGSTDNRHLDQDSDRLPLTSSSLASVRLPEEKEKLPKFSVLGDLNDKSPIINKEAVKIFNIVIHNLNKVFNEEEDLKLISGKLKNQVYKNQFLHIKRLPFFVKAIFNTQIVLSSLTEVGSIYPLKAHAIAVNGKSYIATCEPELNDPYFWVMLFEKESSLLVKLSQTTKPCNTNTDENSYPDDEIDDKSYWPEKGVVLTWGDFIKVENLKEESYSESLVKREFKITINGVSKMVTHLDFTGWKDFSVPDKKAFDALLALVNQEYKKGPITVHCKAGIGRTGTFLSVHSALGMENEMPLRTIYEIRRQRHEKMVETVDQYKFILAYKNKG